MRTLRILVVLSLGLGLILGIGASAQQGWAELAPPAQGASVTAAFTDINIDMVGVDNSNVQWVDYDGDGDLDAFVMGMLRGMMETSAMIYRNDGGTFVALQMDIMSVTSGAADWGDYDNDGDLDLLISGSSYGEWLGRTITKVYRNDAGTFVDINANLIALQSSAADWGDYDNDGDLDLVLTGQGVGGEQIKIYRNDSGLFTDVYFSGLIAVGYGAVAWGDYDNDGDPDLAVLGKNDNYSGNETNIYRNDGDEFVNINAGLIRTAYGSLAWGDYDNDGDLDLALTGEGAEDAIAKIYRNDAGQFVDTHAALHQLRRGTVDWGDYDADGDLDLLLVGRDPNTNFLHSKVYRNDDGTFVNANAGLIGNFTGDASWGDYDNDGDLDILLSGRTEYSPVQRVTKIYRNDGTYSNTPPAAPTGLSAEVVSEDTVVLHWNASAAGSTPVSALTYNVRVGTDPGQGDVLSAQARADGRLLIPEMGNAQHNLSLTLEGLPKDTYYWSVQAVDNTFAGSAFAAEQDFNLLVPLSLEKRAEPRDGLLNNGVVTYTLTLSGPGLDVEFIDPLPAELEYISGTVSAPAVYSPTAHAILWQGTLPTDTVQTLIFQATPGITDTGSLLLATPIVNTAWLTDTENARAVSAMAIVNGRHIHLPIVMQHAE